MNKVTLCGRLVADPETRYSPGPNGENKAYTRYRIAVPRKHKKQNENPQSDFFSCVCFGTLAEFAAKYFRKGGRVLIAGRIENDNYVKDGQTIYGTKIIVEEQEFADSRRSEHENIQSQENITQNNTETDCIQAIPAVCKHRGGYYRNENVLFIVNMVYLLLIASTMRSVCCRVLVSSSLPEIKELI